MESLIKKNEINLRNERHVKSEVNPVLFRIIAKKSVSSIMNEKELLDELNSPFLINSCGNFQDRDNLYLLMEYLRGGDLRYHMCFY